MLCALVFHGDRRFVVPNVDLPQTPVTTTHAGGTGAFAVRRLDATAGYLPAFSLGWKDMRTENGRFAFFKTPLHKTVTIDGLEVRFHQYPPRETAGPEGVGIQPVATGDRVAEQGGGRGEMTTRDMFAEAVDGVAHELRKKTDGMAISYPLPDGISTTTKVIINDLDCRLFRHEQLELAVRCRNAVASASEIVLRGNVMIQADGTRLMSTCVLWDMETGEFSVPGTYVIDRNGVPVRGTGLHCDQHLQPVSVREVYSKKGA